MDVKTLECVHGILYQTCKLCREKDLDLIKVELINFGDGSRKEKVKVEYQEMIQAELDTEDLDIAYDLEEPSDY